ncbi:hypothetical protein N7492_001567 [Penicillium capsulatum]|uniref:Rhodopsin domain-containing protein n=1 Tax=Penicillium capsulatum TaxID=69766 RepID=A0A9W9IUY0_9EURO|nr:hypothetical protein N7492_001567 [Penicillium capsulatum]
MATSSPSAPGMRPPLAAETNLDHAGSIIIITSFTMFLVLGSLGIRVYSAHIRQTRQQDDWTFAGTTILALAQTSLQFVSVHLGWGKTSSLIVARDSMEKTVYSADIFYIAVLVLSKTSTCVFYRTITMRASHWILYGLLGIIILWGPTALILYSVRCSHEPWSDINKTCHILVSRHLHSTRPDTDNDQLSRWQIITAIDIFLEATLVLYPLRVIPRLQTTLSKKVIVVATLGCRLVLIPIAAVHLHYVNTQIESTDPTREDALATICAEIHIAFSVLVLIAPLMKPFVAAYVDDNGLAYTDDASKSRSPQSSRSRTVLGFKSRKPQDSILWTADEDLIRSGSTGADNRILKSVQISVDREGLELSDRATGARLEPT